MGQAYHPDSNQGDEPQAQNPSEEEEFQDSEEPDLSSTDDDDFKHSDYQPDESDDSFASLPYSTPKATPGRANYRARHTPPTMTGAQIEPTASNQPQTPLPATRQRHREQGTTVNEPGYLPTTVEHQARLRLARDRQQQEQERETREQQ